MSIKCLGDQIFEGRSEILLFGKSLMFRVIFQKYALKLIKFWTLLRINSMEIASFLKYFNFQAELWGK